MSVVSMRKILICGPLEEREAVMKELQRQGCLHLTPLSEPPEALSASESREALSRAEKQVCCRPWPAARSWISRNGSAVPKNARVPSPSQKRSWKNRSR